MGKNSLDDVKLLHRYTFRAHTYIHFYIYSYIYREIALDAGPILVAPICSASPLIDPELLFCRWGIRIFGNPSSA